MSLITLRAASCILTQIRLGVPTLDARTRKFMASWHARNLATGISARIPCGSCSFPDPEKAAF